MNEMVQGWFKRGGGVGQPNARSEATGEHRAKVELLVCGLDITFPKEQLRKLFSLEPDNYLNPVPAFVLEHQGLDPSAPAPGYDYHSNTLSRYYKEGQTYPSWFEIEAMMEMINEGANTGSYSETTGREQETKTAFSLESKFILEALFGEDNHKCDKLMQLLCDEKKASHIKIDIRTLKSEKLEEFVHKQSEKSAEKIASLAKRYCSTSFLLPVFENLTLKLDTWDFVEKVINKVMNGGHKTMNVVPLFENSGANGDAPDLKEQVQQHYDDFRKLVDRFRELAKGKSSQPIDFTGSVAFSGIDSAARIKAWLSFYSMKAAAVARGCRCICDIQTVFRKEKMQSRPINRTTLFYVIRQATAWGAGQPLAYFLRGHDPTPQGKWLEDLLNGEGEDLRKGENISWLFPTTTKSSRIKEGTKGTPLLSSQLRYICREDEVIQKNFVRIFEAYLKSCGLQLQREKKDHGVGNELVKVSIAEGPEDENEMLRNKAFRGKNNENHRNISRALSSLGLVGKKDLRDALLECLEDTLVKNYSEIEASLREWRQKIAMDDHFEETGHVGFEGDVSVEKGSYTIVSFPGRDLLEWEELTRRNKEMGKERSNVSTACVFFPARDTQSIWGKHCKEDGTACEYPHCECPKLYFQNTTHGCAWFHVWKQNVRKAVHLKHKLCVCIYDVSGELGDREQRRESFDRAKAKSWPPWPYLPKSDKKESGKKDPAILGTSQVGEISWIEHVLEKPIDEVFYSCGASDEIDELNTEANKRSAKMRP